MSWIDCIYDRTQTDIDDRTAKAFFNILDWARINNNTQIARDIIKIMTGDNVTLNSLTTPTITTIPTFSDLNQLIENIERLRIVAGFPTGAIPALKHDYTGGNSSAAPDFEDVNDWERDIRLIRECIRGRADDMIYCGVANCGQPRIYQARFRIWRGWVPDAINPGRYIRLSSGVKCGQSLTRQNKWRSAINKMKRSPRSGMSICGQSLLRQNGFRRYA